MGQLVGVDGPRDVRYCLCLCCRGRFRSCLHGVGSFLRFVGGVIPPEEMFNKWLFSLIGFICPFNDFKVSVYSNLLITHSHMEEISKLFNACSSLNNLNLTTPYSSIGFTFNSSFTEHMNSTAVLAYIRFLRDKNFLHLIWLNIQSTSSYRPRVSKVGSWIYLVE